MLSIYCYVFKQSLAMLHAWILTIRHFTVHNFVAIYRFVWMSISNYLGMRIDAVLIQTFLMTLCRVLVRLACRASEMERRLFSW